MSNLLKNLLPSFEIKDNCLCVGGKTMARIEKQIGSTPFYVYDSTLIKQRINKLREVLPPSIHLHYAIKANPMPEVVSLISGLVDGLDVASAGEMHIALQSGCGPKDISFAGPGKRIDEIQQAVAAGITLNIESRTELQRVIDASDSAPGLPNVAIRINPDYELRGSGMRMSGGPKQFGIDVEMVPSLLQDMRDMPIHFVGFHIFSGSQSLNAEAICDTQNQAMRLALELSTLAPEKPQFINIGGGFGIPYFSNDEPLELHSIARNLAEIVALRDRNLPGVELVLELGRYLVGEAGLYVCKIVDKKVSRGHTYLVTDGGLHHHLAASGNFGQVLRKDYPVTIANKIASSDSEMVSVVGPLCTPLDLLADRANLPRADIDDYVVVFQSGAYGYSASPHKFLSHPEPMEVLI